MMSQRRRREGLTIHTLPLLRDDIYQYVRGRASYDGVTDGQVARFEANMRQIAQAELWWVRPEMTQIVRAAASDVPTDIHLPDFVPSMSGLLIWETGLGLEGVTKEGEMTQVVGAWWHFLSLTERTGSVIPLILDEESALGVAPSVNNEPPELEDAVLQALIAAWVLSDQPTVGERRREESTLRRSWVPRAESVPSEITVATLRRVKNPPREDDGQEKSEHGAYSHDQA